MKKNNPHTPIMLREAAGTQPRVYARYGEYLYYAPSSRTRRDGKILVEVQILMLNAEFGNEKSESLAGRFSLWTW